MVKVIWGHNITLYKELHQNTFLLIINLPYNHMYLYIYIIEQIIIIIFFCIILSNFASQVNVSFSRMFGYFYNIFI